MKKMIVVAAALVLTFVAFRRFGPTLGKRALAMCQEKCQEMMASHQGDVGAELADLGATSNEEAGGVTLAK